MSRKVEIGSDRVRLEIDYNTTKLSFENEYKDTELHTYIMAKDVKMDTLLSLIDKFGINSIGKFGYNPLMCYVLYGGSDPDILEVLSTQETKEHKNIFGYTAFDVYIMNSVSPYVSRTIAPDYNE